MAVAQTGAIFKALTVDGESSRTYGVYITGQAVYNAPQREVEMISIAGRNGKFALDKGRFENIEVTYPAGIYAETEEDFAEAVSNFRNFLCSRDGYVRIEDEYNPNEYRMGVYKSGLEVTPKLLKAGEFEITFDCKPQRWLNSGETAITVESGDVVTNPTLFESSPLLEVEGYGTMEFNGYSITLENVQIGNVEVLPSGTVSGEKISSDTIRAQRNIQINTFNIGDTVSCNRLNGAFNFTYEGDSSIGDYDRASSSDEGVSVTSYEILGSHKINVNVSFVGGSGSAPTNAGNNRLLQKEFIITIYDRRDVGLDVRFLFTCTCYIHERFPSDISAGFSNISGSSRVTMNSASFSTDAFVVDSTVSALGHPTYVDNNIGEAYMIKDGTVISLNRHIDLGSDLPKLSSGANTVTFDNTITDLKIIPRWWKV